MDRDYIIKVLIQGFDNLSGPVRKAAQEVKAAVNDIKQSFGGLGGGDNDPMGVKQMGTDADNTTRRFGFLRSAANGVRDALRGVRSAVSEVHAGFSNFDADVDRLKQLEREGHNVESTLFGVGQQLGRVASAWQNAFGNKVNIPFFPDLPFAAIIGLLGILLPLLFQLVGTLIAVGSAAAIAAAGLGGALVAGMASLLPIVAVMIPAFIEIKDVFTALGTSSQQLATQQHALAQAHQSVSNAAYGVAQAEKTLAQARTSAARQIVDANNAEKDSILNVKQAELSLIQARQQLRQDMQAQQQAHADVLTRQAQVQAAQQALQIAEQSGNQAQIAQAQAQLAAAQGNLKSAQDAQQSQQSQLKIRQDQLNVQQAQQRLVEAKIQEARAIEAANKANADGVKNAPQVIAAEHDLAQAVRSYRDALYGLHQQQQNMQNLPSRANLEPDQQRLFDLIKNIEKRVKEMADNLAQPIVNGITNGLRIAFNRIMGDPQLLGAIQRVANALGKGITGFLKDLTDPQALKGFTMIANNVAKMTPTFFKFLNNLIELFGKIAQAATPMLDSLFKSFTAWLGNLDKAANVDKLTKFFDKAGTYVKAFADLALSMGHFLGALIGVSAPSGLVAIQKLTDWFNNLADSINDPKKAGGLRNWFKQAVEDTGRFLNALLQIAGAFVKVFSDPKNAKLFVNFIAGLPAELMKTWAVLKLIEDVFAKIFGWVDKIDKDLGGSGGVGGWVIASGVAFLALQPILGIFKAMFTTVSAVARILKDLAVSDTAKGILSRIPGVVRRSGPGSDILKGATTVAGETATAGGVILPAGVEAGAGAAEAGGVGAAAAGGIALGPIAAIAAAVIAIGAGMFLAIKNNFLGVRTALVNAFKQVGGALSGVIDQFKAIWRTLSGKGGLGDAMRELWKALKQLYDVCKPLIKIILELAGSAVIGLLILALKGLANLIQYTVIDPLKLLNSLLKILSSVIGDLEHPVRALQHAFHDLWNFIKGLVKDVERFIHDLTHPGSLAKDVGKGLLGTAEGLGKGALSIVTGGWLPATGGVIGDNGIPQGTGPSGTDTVPAWLTPGEWVLNAAQQTKLAARFFNKNVAAAQDFLFGATGGGATGDTGRSQVVGNSHAPGGGGPTHKARRVKSKDGLVYAIDQDSYGNSITFVELKDGVWAQVAVTPSGKTPLMPGVRGAQYYRRSPVRKHIDELLAKGRKRAAELYARRHHVPLHDFRDFGGQFAPTATPGGQGFAAGGVVEGGSYDNSRHKEINLGGLTINGSGDNVGDATYLLRKAGLVVDLMT